MGFLTFIFFLICGFYLLRLIFRLWLHARIRKFQRDMDNNVGQTYQKTYTWGTGFKRERPAREGEVKVETGKTPGKKVSDRIGDYVEYEEIELSEEGREDS